MMKIKNLKLASLAMAAVMTMTAFPSTAFAAEDLFTSGDVEWGGVVSEVEDLYSFSAEDVAPVADVVDGGFDFSDGLTADEAPAVVPVEEDLFGGDILAAGEVQAVDKATMVFHFNECDPAKDFDVEFNYVGSTLRHTVKGFTLSETALTGEDRPENIADYQTEPMEKEYLDGKKFVMLVEIDGELYHSIKADGSAQWFDSSAKRAAHKMSEEPVLVTEEIVEANKDNQDLVFNPDTWTKGLQAEKKATCLEDGVRQYAYVCSVCGKIDTSEDAEEKYKTVTVEEVKAYGHEYQETTEYWVSEERQGYKKDGTKVKEGEAEDELVSFNSQLVDGKPVAVKDTDPGQYVEVVTTVCRICGDTSVVRTVKPVSTADVIVKVAIPEDDGIGSNIVIENDASYNSETKKGLKKGLEEKDIDVSEATFVKCDDAENSWYKLAYYSKEDDTYKEVYRSDKIMITPGHKAGTVYYYDDANGKKAKLTTDQANLFIFHDGEGATIGTTAAGDKATALSDIEGATVYGTWSCSESLPYYTREECQNSGHTGSKALGNYTKLIAEPKAAHVYLKDNDTTKGDDLEAALDKDGKITFAALKDLDEKNDFLTCDALKDKDGNYLNGFCHDTEVTVVYTCQNCKKATEEVKVTVIGEVDALGVNAKDEDILAAHKKVAGEDGIVNGKVPGTEVEATCSAQGHFEKADYCSACGDMLGKSTVVYTATKPHTYGDPEIIYEGTVVVDKKTKDAKETGWLYEQYKGKVNPVEYCYTDTEWSRDAVLGVRPVVAKVCTICGHVDEQSDPEGLKTVATYVEMQGKGCIAGTITLESTYTVDKKVVATGGPKSFPYYTTYGAYWGADVHTPSNEWVKDEASVAEDGSYNEVMHCLVCDQIIKTRFVPAPTHVHTGQAVDGVEATCTEAGKKAHYVCTGCKLLFEDEACTKQIEEEALAIPATGHKIGEEEVPEVAATCATAGVKAHFACEVCGEKFVKDEAGEYVAATDEELAIAVLTEDAANAFHLALFQKAVAENDATILFPAKEATCAEDGNIAFAKCPFCGKLATLVDGAPKEVTAEEVIVKATGEHTPAEPVVEDGYKVVYCSVCGKELSREKEPEPIDEPTEEVPGKVVIKKSSAYVNSNTLKVSIGAVEGATSYRVGVKPAGGNYTTKKITDASEAVLFEGLKAGEKYVVRAYAKNKAGKGEYSYKFRWMQSVDVKLSVAGKDGLKVDISGADGASKYVIRYSTTKDMASYKTVTTTEPTATITGLKAGQKYYVRVIPYAKEGKKTYRGALSSRAAKTIK